MRKIILFMSFLFALNLWAGRVTDIVEMRIAPADGEWTVRTGTDVSFRIILTESNVGVKEAEIEYEISEDLMAPRTTGRAKLKNGIATIKGGTMKQPGFLRCRARYVNGDHTYTALGTIGFSPEKIKPTVNCPADFMEFWNRNLTAARKVDLKPQMTLLPDKCTETVDVYQISYCVGSQLTRFYGMLAIPKGEGTYPAMVQYPGAGIYAIDAPVAFAEKGIIAMAVGIHAIPNNLDAEYYNQLNGGALGSYPTINMERREEYYYNRVIQGAVRAVDFIETLPQFNGCIATYGGSQGGYLSIAVAALHHSVKYAVSNFPAMSDLTGYANGRAGGWPHIFKNEANRTQLLFENLSYYDTVNFARNLTVPVFMAFGFNDLTCAPTTTYSVYNTISSPKELYTAPLAGHFLLTEQADAEKAALMKFLRNCSE